MVEFRSKSATTHDLASLFSHLKSWSLLNIPGRTECMGRRMFTYRTLHRSDQLQSELCRVCQSDTTVNGYLYRCLNKSCGAVHWDKARVKRLRKSSDEELKDVLRNADVPYEVRDKKGHFVYVLRLRGELNAVYVGMTGLHPYARYLNHLRGYKASSHAKKRATAMIKFEGPMPYEKAKLREPALAKELLDQGYIVYGGH